MQKFFAVVAIAVFVLTLVFASVAGAQAPEDLLEGQTAFIEDDDADPGTIPNSVGPIAVAGCTAEEGARVRVEDPNGTQVDLIDNQNVEITTGPQAITIEGTGQNGNIVANPVPREEGTDSRFNIGTGTVIESEGITCQAGGGQSPGGDQQADDEQYEDDEDKNIIINIPNKPLPNTGGPHLLGLAVIGLASIVAGASVFRAGVRRRR